METECVDLKLKIQEINSSLRILQQAIQNENDVITYTNIDDYLEIIIEKTSNILDSFDYLSDKIFVKNN